MTPISALPLMTLDPAWVEQHPAFCSGDPRLAQALVRLLFAAWRGAPAGTIPGSMAYLAMTSGLSEAEVEDSFGVLLAGWSRRDDGRLQHDGLANVAARLSAAYGQQIENYVMAAAMSAQDPDEFAIASHEAVNTKTPRGKCSLPKDFGYGLHPELRTWVARQLSLVDEAGQDWIMGKFRDFAMSRDTRSKSWVSEFRSYADTAVNSWGHRPPQQAVSVVSGAAPRQAPFGNPRGFGAPGKGEVLAATNRARFNEATQRMASRRAETRGEA